MKPQSKEDVVGEQICGPRRKSVGELFTETTIQVLYSPIKQGCSHKSGLADAIVGVSQQRFIVSILLLTKGKVFIVDTLFLLYYFLLFLWGWDGMWWRGWCG